MKRARPPSPDGADQSRIWPPSLTALKAVFQALNTVYSFCSTRKHLAITFDTVKASVENLTKKKLTIGDLAAIKFLCPSLMSCSYVDKEQLHTSKSAEDIYEPNAGFSPYVLLFEFHDGELEPKNKGTKKNYSDMRGAHSAPLPMTKLTKLIEKRNAKFDDAVTRYLEDCEQNGFDPEDRLIISARSYIPVQPILNDNSWKPGDANETGTDRTISIPELIALLKQQRFYENQLVEGGSRSFAQKTAEYGELKVPLHNEITKALNDDRKITRLYSHQAKAINDLNDGHSVIVSTSTASGKSLIYQIPVLEALLKDPEARAMYIFPTKALAQDQKRALQNILFMCPGLRAVKISTFDGDTPTASRPEIRSDASIIFTNFDMIHLAILPFTQQWKEFMSNLKYIVVDELHVYKGLFGAHCALVMRRLIRMCERLGNSRVQFVSCSATIGNPEQHMMNMLGIDNVRLTSNDGSPSGQKEFVIWNPPYIDPKDLNQGRKNVVVETAQVFELLMSNNVRTIVFCKTRKICELLMKQIRTNLQRGQNARLLKKVMSYRAGYTPQDRRRIEQQMFNGELLGVIATSALELGVDIGSLDAVLMLGVPWSLSAMWQQSGRAGRRNKDSLSLLVTDHNPFDQYYTRCPGALFDAPHADITVDYLNPLVLETHLQCAAAEAPIKCDEDKRFFGEGLEEICKERLVFDEKWKVYFCHPKLKPFPWKHINIRNAQEDLYAVVDATDDRNVIIEEIEASRATFTIYEGAIYIHQGITYIVEETNVDRRYAKIRMLNNINWTTQQRDYTDVDAVETQRTRHVKDSLSVVHFGAVRVSTTVFGYFKMDDKARILDAVDVNMPPIVRDKVGLWVDVPRAAIDHITSLSIDLNAAIHAAAHSLISLLPVHTYSAMGDVRTELLIGYQATRPRPARYSSFGLAITLYESQASNITSKVFQFFDDLTRKASDAIENCPCEAGCPQCVHSSICSEKNELCSKLGALIILRAILNDPLARTRLEEKVPDELVLDGEFDTGDSAYWDEVDWEALDRMVDATQDRREEVCP